MNYLAESFAVLAMLINFMGYRQTNLNRYRLVSGLAMLALGTHFLLLDALAAAIGCYLAFFRNLVSMVTQALWVVVFFVLLNLAFLTYEFVVLNHGLMILLAYTSSIIFTLGTFVLSSTTLIRKTFFVAECLNLIYAISVGSIVGTIGILVNMTSIIIKLWQEKKKTAAETKIS